MAKKKAKTEEKQTVDPAELAWTEIGKLKGLTDKPLATYVACKMNGLSDPLGSAKEKRKKLDGKLA